MYRVSATASGVACGVPISSGVNRTWRSVSTWFQAAEMRSASIPTEIAPSGNVGTGSEVEVGSGVGVDGVESPPHAVRTSSTASIANTRVTEEPVMKTWRSRNMIGNLPLLQFAILRFHVCMPDAFYP